MFSQLEEFSSFNFNPDYTADQKYSAQKQSQKSYGLFSAKTNTFYLVDEQTYRYAIEQLKIKAQPQVPPMNLERDPVQTCSPMAQTEIFGDIWDYYSNAQQSFTSFANKCDPEQI